MKNSFIQSGENKGECLIHDDFRRINIYCMSKELLEEHIKLIIEYDDYYSNAGSSGLFKTLVNPFLNVGKVAIAGTKKISASMKALFKTIYAGIKQITFPLIDQDFEQIKLERDSAIEKINQQYSDVYNTINKTFDNDILTMFFIYDPIATFLLYKKFSKKKGVGYNDYDEKQFIKKTKNISNAYKNTINNSNKSIFDDLSNIEHYTNNSEILKKLESNQEYHKLPQKEKDDITKKIKEYTKQYYKKKIEDEIKIALNNEIPLDHPLIMHYKSILKA
jgi:hypothetical protein